MEETMVEIELKDEERQECEIWTRVMGYHRPVSEFNRGKKSEFRARKCFTEEKAIEGMKEDHKVMMAAE
jgi:hypothetical protein